MLDFTRREYVGVSADESCIEVSEAADYHEALALHRAGPDRAVWFAPVRDAAPDHQRACLARPHRVSGTRAAESSAAHRGPRRLEVSGPLGTNCRPRSAPRWPALAGALDAWVASWRCKRHGGDVRCDARSTRSCHRVLPRSANGVPPRTTERRTWEGHLSSDLSFGVDGVAWTRSNHIAEREAGHARLPRKPGLLANTGPRSGRRNPVADSGDLARHRADARDPGTRRGRPVPAVQGGEHPFRDERLGVRHGHPDRLRYRGYYGGLGRRPDRPRRLRLPVVGWHGGHRRPDRGIPGGCRAADRGAHLSARLRTFVRRAADPAPGALRCL